mmetsp:Transcript_1240/g.5269  ORF Transcript_1240/g.5269 Transcript_1240/m.5269 type:complete len:222 (+) Transcript_1240:790-1455(+)
MHREERITHHRDSVGVVHHPFQRSEASSIGPHKVAPEDFAKLAFAELHGQRRFVRARRPPLGRASTHALKAQLKVLLLFLCGREHEKNPRSVMLRHGPEHLHETLQVRDVLVVDHDGPCLGMLKRRPEGRVEALLLVHVRRHQVHPPSYLVLSLLLIFALHGAFGLGPRGQAGHGPCQGGFAAARQNSHGGQHGNDVASCLCAVVAWSGDELLPLRGRRIL